MKAVKAFSKDGWFVARQTGSHIIMIKSGPWLRFRCQSTENLIEVHSGSSSDSLA